MDKIQALEKNKICKIQWCWRDVKNYTRLCLCAKHYERLKKFWDPNHITRFDKRKAIVEWNIAKIPLWVNWKHWYCIIDSNFLFLENYQWTLWSHWYAVTWWKWNYDLMHHKIIGKVKWLHIDHINWNRLDNRISNLRLTHPWDNLFNQLNLRSNNKAWHTWVSYSKKLKKYESYISYRWKKIFWWYYVDVLDAIKKRKEMEEIYYKWIKC